jgi:pullulanase/glycogen debranching enzyme
VQQRFRHLAAGARLELDPARVDTPTLRRLHRGELLLVQQDSAGRVLQATALQSPGALDDLYAAAENATDLGVTVLPATVLNPAVTPAVNPAVTPSRNPSRSQVRSQARSHFTLWAPTAQRVWRCHFPPGSASQQAALSVSPLQRDETTGLWRQRVAGDLTGTYYNYLVDVWVDGVGLVRQRVTDPYAISLDSNARRTWIGSLADPALQPPGWSTARRPPPLAAATDLVVYELHVRDFSILDASVPPADRGKYGAFSHAGSEGMQQLAALARAGLTDIHLLPVFDIASVPELGCSSPQVPDAGPDSPLQQAAVMAGAAGDCFNWGYDPLHFNAPDGSYASRADDGALRIREFRQMVLALHGAGLRVGMDVVYNHLSASGQQADSVLDRIVPGYYHRLDAQGQVERSTCCANTATEHRMMGKLMQDSVRLWARAYQIDSFRFDLMGHQPRAAMVRLQDLLRQDNGRDIALLGEGWNFGEVANGARFVQAAQGVLNGTGIATFNDRLRDALRGGGASDGPTEIVARQGYLNGLVYAPNDAALAAGVPPASALMAAADAVRLGLAGNLASYRFATHTGQIRSGAEIAYGDQPAGYASQPGEVVNYVENHDNHTLWDINAFKLPLATPASERARVQALGLAFVALSQGLPYFHAGSDLLRSKSMDGNSYDSGDHFNRLDWRGQDNGFGSGLPPARDNATFYPLIAPRLAAPQLKPAPADMAFSRAVFRDLLRIRASSRLFRLASADAVQQRLRFHNTGPAQNPVLIAAELFGELDGQGTAQRLPGAGYGKLMLLFNVSPAPQGLQIPSAAGQDWVLHPVQQAAGAGDRRAATESAFDRAQGRFTVPGRTTLVYVLH